MFLVGNPILIKWVLAPTGTPLLESDYDLALVDAPLNGTYTDAGLTNYVAPTATTPGIIEYTLTVNTAGFYKVQLTTGTAAAHTLIDEKTFFVLQNAPVALASTIATQGKSNTGPEI